MTSPIKTPAPQKRKGGPHPTQVYRRVEQQPLAITEHGEVNANNIDGEGTPDPTAQAPDNLNETFPEREPKKKRPTPPTSESSAAAAS